MEEKNNSQNENNNQENNYESPNPPLFNFYFCIAALFDIIDTFLPFSGIALDAIASLLIGRWVTKNGGLTFGKGGENPAPKTSGGSLTDQIKDTITSAPMKLFMAYLIEQIPGLSMLLPTWTLSVISTSKNRSKYYIVLGTWVLFIPISIMVLIGLLFPSGPSAATTTGQCGFDTSKLAQYSGGGPAEPDAYKVMHPNPADDTYGIKYALKIGVPQEEIKPWTPDELFELAREEIYKQWPNIQNIDSPNNNIILAHRAVMTYIRMEGVYKFVCLDCPYNTAQNKGSQNRNLANRYLSEGLSPDTLFPYVSWYDPGDDCYGYPTYHTPSITCYRYKEGFAPDGGKNKQYAIAWDVKFALYEGIKEIFNFYQGASGTGEQKWKNAIGMTFLPNDSNAFWEREGAEDTWNDTANTETQEKIDEVKTKCELKSLAQVPLIKQADPRWGSLPYNSACEGATYANSACGATSLTMVIAYFTGREDLYPPEIGDQIVARGWRPCGQGTAWEAMTGIPQLYGLKSQEIGLNWSAAQTCFQNGGIIIASMGDCQFTRNGHFIVLTGESNGTVHINDPGGRNITNAPYTDIINPTCGKNMWCINNK